jgi:hypothetical protein
LPASALRSAVNHLIAQSKNELVALLDALAALSVPEVLISFEFPFQSQM